MSAPTPPGALDLEEIRAALEKHDNPGGAGWVADLKHFRERAPSWLRSLLARVEALEGERANPSEGRACPKCGEYVVFAAGFCGIYAAEWKARAERAEAVAGEALDLCTASWPRLPQEYQRGFCADVERLRARLAGEGE